MHDADVNSLLTIICNFTQYSYLTSGLDKFSAGIRNYSILPKCPGRLWRPHNLIYDQYLGHCTRGIKRPVREASFKVKNKFN